MSLASVNAPTVANGCFYMLLYFTCKISHYIHLHEHGRMSYEHAEGTLLMTGGDMYKVDPSSRALAKFYALGKS
jgi:hypothetical protein